MLEQEKGTKTVFNFEEEDAAPKEAKKLGPGRPKKVDEDDMLDEEEDEY